MKTLIIFLGIIAAISWLAMIISTLLRIDEMSARNRNIAKWCDAISLVIASFGLGFVVIYFINKS